MSGISPFMPELAASDRQVFGMSGALGDDECEVRADEAANREIMGYSTLATHGAERDSLIRFTSVNTNLRYGDGVGTPAPGLIDTATMLRNSDAWHARGRQQLWNRTYHAGADLSRGNPELIDRDTAVTHGFNVTTDRSAALSGVSIDRFDPSPPAEVQTVQHIVPTAWVRGGDNTRESARTLARMT